MKKNKKNKQGEKKTKRRKTEKTKTHSHTVQSWGEKTSKKLEWEKKGQVS